MNSGILTRRFVFINKSAQSTSLSQSEGDERRQIFTHVQNDFNEPRETFISTTPSDFERVSKAQTLQPRRRQTHERSHPLSIRSIDYSGLDGFEAAPWVTVSGNMREKLAYYLDKVVDIIFPVRSIAAEARQHVFECAAEEPAALFGLLSVVNASIFSICHNNQYLRESVRYRGLALLHVRKRLHCRSTIGPSTAFAVAQLLRVECGQGDYDAIKIHFDGLLKMMETIDSPSEIPFPLLLGVQSCLYLCAATLRTAPPVVSIACGPKRIVAARLSNVLALEGFDIQESLKHSFVSRFQLQSYKDFVGPTLLDVLTVFYELRSVRQVAEQKSLPLSTQQAHTLNTEPLSLEHRLLSMSFPVTEHKPYGAAREAIRLALYILSVPPVPISEPRNPFRASLAGQMREALGQSNIRGLWTPCTDLLLWAVVIAASVSYHQDEWGWIVSHAAMICRGLRITTLSSFHEALMDLDPTLGRFADLPGVMWLYMQECPTDLD